jgi:hypothetical protein
MNRRELFASTAKATAAVALGAELASSNGRALAQAQSGTRAPSTGEAEMSAEDAKLAAARSATEQAQATWAGSLALQAATYAAPLVAMYNLRASVALGPKPKAPPGAIWRFEDIATPTLAAQSGYVTPNVNVVYGFGFADLKQEPHILTAPDSGGRYYMVEVVDMWTNAFAYPAGGPSGYKGGRFAFVGPGWTGMLPADVRRIDCPTRWIEFQPRVYVKDQADLPAALAVLRAIKLQGLSEYSGGAPLKAPTYDYDAPRMNPKVATSMMQFDDPLQFWSIFASAIAENPPPQNEIDSVLPQFKYLGIELGKPWSAAGVGPVYLTEMKKAAQSLGGMIAQSVALIGLVKNGWLIPPADVGFGGADYMSRGGVAVFGLTANTPIQAIYYTGTADGNGEPFTGEQNYTVTFTGAMTYAQPVPPGFWSLTMYDGVTRYSVPNPINRYSLGSSNDLKRNADGSLTLYLQHNSPGADKEANWLPAPAGPFYLILRNYAPTPAVAEGLKDPASFEGPPAVTPVG